MKMVQPGIGIDRGHERQEKLDPTRLDRLSRCLAVLELATRPGNAVEDDRDMAAPSRITLDMVRTLLHVAANPMQSVSEIGRAFGRPSSTTSRQLLDLGIKNRDNTPGFGLVEPVPDPIDMRVKRYRLTDQGRKTIANALRELREPQRE